MGRAKAVMVSHAAGVDGMPAALSAAVATRLLRGRLGFGGAAFSDDLEMGALDAFGDLPERCSRASAAGCDLLLVCRRIEAYPACVRAVESGVPPRDDLLKLTPSEPAQIVISVKSIESKGDETVVTLEEKSTADLSKDPKKHILDERTITSTITPPPSGPLTAGPLSMVLQMVRTQDYFWALGVERNATVAEVGRAYDALARKFHADRYRGRCGFLTPDPWRAARSRAASCRASFGGKGESPETTATRPPHASIEIRPETVSGRARSFRGRLGCACWCC